MTNQQKIILTPEDAVASGVHYTCKHEGKLKGIYSLSTSCTDNPICLKSKDIEGSVCQKCYASRLLAYRKALLEPLTANAWILSSLVITKGQAPIIPTRYFRFESFGELINATQVINYFRIAEANPKVKCALWTKQPHIIDDAIKSGYKKPRNLEIVQSSLMLNKPSVPTHTFVDKVFTVFTREYLKEHADIKINCGARSCVTCGLCYNRQKTLTFVNELLK